MIRCRLLYHSSSVHLQQLYTGFSMLQAAGSIALTQSRRHGQVDYSSGASHLKDAGHAHLDVVVNDSTKLHFDTHDAAEVAVDSLEQCDFYFKRSFLKEYVQTLPARLQPKLVPLGLNYRVLPDTVDFHYAQRQLFLRDTLRQKAAAFKQAFDVHNRLGFQPRVSKMASPPDLAADPRVLFLAATYDPYDNPERSREKIEDRISINETRAQCLRQLRAELGPRFSGGFVQNDYSLRTYPELVVPKQQTVQESYLKTMKSHPICIATTGLHGSIGWKFAEYVAFSKAIVSEKLVYEVPGDFAAGKNYLEFRSPDECVGAAVRLMSDANLRAQIMKNNADYYQSCLRPDVLVLNALRTALSGHSRDNRAYDSLPAAAAR